jgi:hypothetical protein
MSGFFHAVSVSMEAMLPMAMLLMTAAFAAMRSSHQDNYQKYWVLKKARNFSYYPLLKGVVIYQSF